MPSLTFAQLRQDETLIEFAKTCPDNCGSEKFNLLKVREPHTFKPPVNLLKQCVIRRLIAHQFVPATSFPEEWWIKPMNTLYRLGGERPEHVIELFQTEAPHYLHNGKPIVQVYTTYSDLHEWRTVHGDAAMYQPLWYRPDQPRTDEFLNKFLAIGDRSDAWGRFPDIHELSLNNSIGMEIHPSFQHRRYHHERHFENQNL